MAFLNPANMSRLFRLSLMFVSAIFAVSFLYQTTYTNSARRQTSRTFTLPVHPAPPVNSARGRQPNPFLRMLSTSRDELVKENHRRGDETSSSITRATTNSTVLSRSVFAKEDVDPFGFPESIKQIKRKNGLLLERTKETISDLKSKENLTDRRTKTLDQLKAILDNLRVNSNIKDVVNDEQSSASDGDRSKKPVFIVILARMRTGSTLVGEIFNQNPDLFYLFEPLISLDAAMRAGQFSFSDHGTVSSNLLLEYSRCSFPHGFTEHWLEWEAGSTRSQKLRPLCDFSTPRKVKCTNITAAQLERTCERVQGNMCMKTIRSDLDYFRPLVDAGINVKIIHLVRDPRGTTNSRKQYYMVQRPKLPRRLSTNLLQGPPAIPRLRGRLDLLGLLGHHPDYVVHTVPRLCQWMRDSVLGAQKKPAWIRNRYKLVRYEDFALEPLRVARDLYDFVGLDYPPAVMRWIVANTHSDDARSVKFFSTHKNSTETAMRWRHTMRPLQVRQVEEICADAMKLLGYKVVPDHAQLANESVSLMGPLPIVDMV